MGGDPDLRIRMEGDGDDLSSPSPSPGGSFSWSPHQIASARIISPSTDPQRRAAALQEVEAEAQEQQRRWELTELAKRSQILREEQAAAAAEVHMRQKLALQEAAKHAQDV